MRLEFILAVALLLTACAPAAPPAAEPPAASSAPSPRSGEAQVFANPGFRATAEAELTQGQWFARADEGVTAAGFGTPESEFQLVIACESGSGQVTITSDHELAPDQDTMLTLITATESLAMPARSFNEGLPHVSATLRRVRTDGRDPWAMLTGPQERFGVEAGGDLRVYPWDESIARALRACS